ncbi:MAG: beta strand repeat-containing protein [Pseudanabaenaceae cyanobacterium]|jgi:hypothetical protein
MWHQFKSQSDNHSPESKKLNKQRLKKGSIFRRLVATTLAFAGATQLAPYLALAQLLTPAGTDIKNRATGTYTDPNNPNTPLPVTSNEVTVTVQKVAGITVKPTDEGVVDTNGGSVNLNDPMQYKFLVNNTGNYNTDIFIPALNDILATNLNKTSVSLLIVDATGTPVAGTINGVAVAANTPFSPANATTTTTVNNIPPGGGVKVIVNGTVTASVSGTPVAVQLGDTGTNNNDPTTTQNQPDTGTGSDGAANANDIRTLNPTGAVNPPVNGEREAAASQQVTVGVQIQPLALATILKKRDVYTPNTPATTDDTITYRLDMRVDGSIGNPNFVPAPLAGTDISVDGATVNRILVSDAIPASTVYVANSATAPAGWTVVYSTTTITDNNTNALNALWTTTQPAASQVKRVGYIYTGTLNANSSTATDANGFRFTVVTSGLPAGGGTVANIAQIFGTTSGVANSPIVYDESGDQNPNNFSGNTPPNNNPNGTLWSPATDPTGGASGVANPTTQGTDSGNDNSGKNPADTGGTGTLAFGGEDNIISIGPSTSILNGPNASAGAVGPTNNNDDFTNLSTGLTAANAVPGSAFDPNLITFNNTFQNTGNGNLDRVTLLPLAPADPRVPANPGSPRQNTDIPNGTTVRLQGTVPADPALGIPQRATPQTFDVTYTYDSATGIYDITAGTAPNLFGIKPGEQINYTTAVDIPAVAANQALSADRFSATNDADRAGFSIPIVAFSEDGKNVGAPGPVSGSGVATRPSFNYDPTKSAVDPAQEDPIYNITIDRVYTGFVRLLKKSQVIKGTGPDVPGPSAVLDTTSKLGAPGNIIRYVIEYVNFSTPATPGSSGNGTLTAGNLVVCDDGANATAPFNNNWSTTTLHALGTTALSGSTVTFHNGGDCGANIATGQIATATGTGASVSSDPAAATVISRYVNNIGTLVPAVNPSTAQGQLEFRRLVK